jgi:hypothetical protein
MMRVFISHAPDDSMYRDALASHIEVLCASGIITSWHSGMIAPGEDWKEVVDRELEKTDLVIFLVSASFLASRSCQETELAPALERWKQMRLRLMPVIVRACDWRASSIARLKVLPAGGRPVATWPHQDEAWAEVTRTLRITTAWTSMSRAFQRAAPDQLQPLPAAPAAVIPDHAALHAPDLSRAHFPALASEADNTAAHRRLHVLCGVRGGFSSSGYTDLTGEERLLEALRRVCQPDEAVYPSLSVAHHSPIPSPNPLPAVVFLNLGLPSGDLPNEMQLVCSRLPCAIFILYASGEEYQECMKEGPPSWTERFQHYYLLRKSSGSAFDIALRRILDEAKQLAFRRCGVTMNGGT